MELFFFYRILVSLLLKHCLPLPSRNQLIFLCPSLCLYKMKKSLATYAQKNVLINDEVMSEKYYIKTKYHYFFIGISLLSSF